MSSFRIPLDLQAVFMKSNQGKEVRKAPDSAMRVFKRFSGLLQGGSSRRQVGEVKASRDATETSQDMDVSNNGVVESVTTVAASQKSKATEQKSPQQWAEEVLAGRGYNIEHVRTVDTDYYNPASPLQLASYNTRSVDICTRNVDLEALRAMLFSGISPNACSAYGESIMHKVCRMGHAHVLRVFVEFGAELKTTDEQGRTLLHDACWAPRPAFREFALLLQADPNMLFMADNRGACPFDYIPEDDYAVWIEFLERNVDRFWPEDATHRRTNRGKPGSRPISDPANALTVKLATMVANGRLTPREAMQLKQHEETVEDEGSEDESEDGSVECSSSSSMFDDDGEYSSCGETSHGTQDDLHMLQELGVVLY